MRFIYTFRFFLAIQCVLVLSAPALAETTTPTVTFVPSQESSIHVSFLMYHHVSESTPRVTSVTPQELREHLTYLRDNGFNVIDLQLALAGIQGQAKLPEKAVVITFDDAYQNIFTAGRPLLKEFDMPWTLFVTTDPIGDIAGQYMSWEQLKTLHDEGVLIANHSKDHAHMPRRLADESHSQWRQRMQENILHAQHELETRLGIQHKLFAYPYGEYNNELKELVADLGFIAFGQHSGGVGAMSDLQAIPRFAAAGVYANLRSLGTKMAALSFTTHEVNYDDTLLAYETTQPTLTVRLDTQDFYPNQLQCFIAGEVKSPTWLNADTFSITADSPVPIGRSRYNCTAPSKAERGRFYWYSIQWIRQDQQGSWPD